MIALSLMVLVSLSEMAALPPAPAPDAALPAPRSVLLSASDQGDIPEVSIRPGLITTLLFAEPLRLAGVELEREHFSRVFTQEDALQLLPSGSLKVGQRLRLRVRFMEGSAPASADFLLVVDPSRVDQQVNVDVLRPPGNKLATETEASRTRDQRCEAELTQVRERPDGLTDLLATGVMDGTGVLALHLGVDQNLVQRSRSLPLTDLYSYRAKSRVAVAVRLRNISASSWKATGAELVREDGTRLKVLRVWQREPASDGTEAAVVVEAEATKNESQGRFTLSLWQDDKAPGVLIEGVTFP